jgi:hypothetical protein
METDVNQDLEDYWNEFKLLDGSLEEGEDYGSRSCDGKFIIYRNIYKFLIIYISVKICTIHLMFKFCVWHNGNLHVRKYYWQD